MALPFSGESAYLNITGEGSFALAISFASHFRSIVPTGILEKIVDVRHADARANPFAAYVLVLLAHVLKKVRFKLVCRGEIGVASFGGMGMIMPAVPCEEGLPEARCPARSRLLSRLVPPPRGLSFQCRQRRDGGSRWQWLRGHSRAWLFSTPTPGRGSFPR